jgi:hypothetical protein
MGNWKYIITGKALKEVLTEGKSFPCIKESREYQTFESAITEIQKFISGKMSWCFASCDTDYKEAYNRLMKEINRI